MASRDIVNEAYKLENLTLRDVYMHSSLQVPAVIGFGIEILI